MMLTVGASLLEVDTVGTTGEWILLLPALGATSWMWEAQIKELSLQYRVISYSQCGPWNGSRERTIRDLSKELSQVMDVMKVERAHIIGISMGGMVAQDFAARCASRVISLVLACTTPRQSIAGLQRLESCAETVDRAGMLALVEPTIQRWFTPAFINGHPNAINTIRGMLSAADPTVYSSLARGVAHVDLLQQLGDISATTLIIRADSDLAIEPEAASFLQSRIARSQVVNVSNAGHMCNIEQQSVFTRQIVSFLDEHHQGGDGTD